MLLGLSLLGGIVTAGIAFPAAIGLGLVANDASDSVGSVSTEVLDQPLPQTTIVTDSAGTTIAQLFVPDQNRRSVTSDEISPAMKAAIVAVEDRRFYQHQGVDWQGTVRAVVTNSVSGSIEQGASTLTQQYVKNYLLYVDAQTETERLKATEQTPARKLKEAQIALQLEQSLSKDEILTRYLNIVPFGNGAAGIASAARTYFGVTPADLTVPQAALLAGMVRSTTATDPVTNPQAAQERRNLVIQQMLEQQMIDRTQADAALAEPLGIASPLNTQANGCIGAGPAGFFCQYVQEYLSEAGISGEQLRTGGYTIRTTLDRGVLDLMQASLVAEVPADQPNVANVMATVEPGAEGHRVLAMGSSRVFGLDADALETSYGLPYTPVPLGAGSVYKTFTVATALEKGLGINYQLSVPPSGYASPIYVDGGGRPLPVQNSGDYAERLSLSDALAQSPNTAFVKLMEFTGVPDVVDMAVRLGMRSLATERFVDPNTGQPTDRSIAEVTKAQRQASFTLGVSPTSVLELSNVGATLASSGMWCPPTPIASITDPEGNPVTVTEAPCEQVVEPGLANAMMNALGRDELPGGTAAGAASQVGWDRPMAGKTGTTQANKSAAFLGVVPQLSGAVITYDNDNRPDALCDGAGSPFACARGNIFGGKTPAETWFGTMSPLLEGQAVIPLPPVDERYLEGGAESQVADVVGRSENDARATLESAGWAVTTRERDNAAPRGTVIGQSPRGTALPGETIVLTVSSGEVPPPPAAPSEAPAEGEQPPPAEEGDGGVTTTAAAARRGVAVRGCGPV
ncbi:penicillin-binding protein [Pseudonocardia sp. KRD-184]|uniref:Penicillin-binding protein n=1 Tax=Pseudonocardia oceani TaxID=2792013 RepID=A0ABS6U2X3_9PSEU|nr:penicillin-binding protein [Pseudonocardia oceani]MBW0121842.1 penicillin-binding protein [Pseudonocardia oceani]MBW0126602.1 penicillin-binding protein [Pseudonocardia oceani]